MCIRNFIKYLVGRSIGKFFCTKNLLAVPPLMLFTVVANAQVLKSMEVVNLQNNVQELRLNFDKDVVAAPSHFSLHQPSRVVLDFSGGKFDDSQRSRTFNNGLLESVVNIKSSGKLRTTIAMTGEADYSVRDEGSSVIVSFKPKSSVLQNGDSWDNSVPSNNPNSGTSLGKDVEFYRNSKGSGVVEITLQSPSAIVKTRDSKNLVSVSISNTQWSSTQERRLDVTSFGTPVKDIAIQNVKGTATVNINAQAGFQYSSYQAGNKYIVELKPVKNSLPSSDAASTSSSEASGKKEYKGELLSLNFQDIEVRAVLQVIADFTGLNIVVSDDVNSRITVRLQNVPWDQALDVILKSKGLDSRKQGNIIYVAPLEVLAKFDTAKPLTSETIQINYAKAEDIAKVLLDGKKSNNKDNFHTASAGLSERGTVSVDPRTNNLLVQDISEQLVIIRNLIKVLDQPVRQVQIDAKVVIATDNFAREIGVKWGVAGVGKAGGNTLIGTSGAAGTTGGASTLLGTGSGGTPGVVTIPSLGQRLGADLAAAGATSGLGLAVLGKDFLVDFELSAMQNNSQGEIISSPRVLTADRKTAYIKQGSEIAYNKLDDSGNTTTAFKEVVLELNVTPQITPDNKIIMDLMVKKDTVEGESSDGTPAIGKREVSTQALVADGETVVLGGVYEQITSETLKKVPLLADIPWLGNLFKNKKNETSRAELLIFVTPRLVSPNLLRK